MSGIFDDLFDLNSDGWLDETERFIRDAELLSILEEEEDGEESSDGILSDDDGDPEDDADELENLFDDPF